MMSGDRNRMDDSTGTLTTCRESPSRSTRGPRARPFIACPPLPQQSIPLALTYQQSCSPFRGSLLLTVSLPHSFFIFSSLSVTTGGDEDSLIHLVPPPYQS